MLCAVIFFFKRLSQNSEDRARVRRRDDGERANSSSIIVIWPQSRWLMVPASEILSPPSQKNLTTLEYHQTFPGCL